MGGPEAGGMGQEQEAGSVVVAQSLRARAIADRLTCSVCSRLYREATTVTECLHTFCKGCIDAAVCVGSNANKCPKCGVALATDPYKDNQIVFDRTLNDVVTKLFPRPSDGVRAKLREQKLMEEQSRKRKAMESQNRGRKHAVRQKKVGERPVGMRNDTTLGCSKCRYSLTGCRACRDWVQRAKQLKQERTPAASTPAAEGFPVATSTIAPTPTPATNPAAAEATSNHIKVVITADAEDPSLPPLARNCFKANGDVRVSTLAVHVMRRLETRMGIRLCCRGELLPLDMTMEEIIEKHGSLREEGGAPQPLLQLEFRRAIPPPPPPSTQPPAQAQPQAQVQTPALGPGHAQRQGPPPPSSGKGRKETLVLVVKADPRDPSLPTLTKSSFKANTDVRVGTLAVHVVKRLVKLKREGQGEGQGQGQGEGEGEGEGQVAVPAPMPIDLFCKNERLPDDMTMQMVVARYYADEAGATAVDLTFSRKGGNESGGSGGDRAAAAANAHTND